MYISFCFMFQKNISKVSTWGETYSHELNEVAFQICYFCCAIKSEHLTFQFPSTFSIGWWRQPDSRHSFPRHQSDSRREKTSGHMLKGGDYTRSFTKLEPTRQEFILNLPHWATACGLQYCASQTT